MVYTETMLTVKQISKIAGITPRTLHYYDEIGLLKPDQIGENGYRYYEEESLLRLQQILLYKELDMPLENIRRFLEAKDFNVIAALEIHKNELHNRIARLEMILTTVDQTIDHLKGNKSMKDFQIFKGLTQEEEAENERAAMQRFDPETVKNSYKKWNTYSKDEQQRILDEGNRIYMGMVEAIPDGPASSAAQTAIERWRQHIEYFWSPNEEQLAGLTHGYVNDPAFRDSFDRIDPRLAEFFEQAVKVYLDSRRIVS